MSLSVTSRSGSSDIWTLVSVGTREDALARQEKAIDDLIAEVKHVAKHYDNFLHELEARGLGSKLRQYPGAWEALMNEYLNFLQKDCGLVVVDPDLPIVTPSTNSPAKK